MMDFQNIRNYKHLLLVSKSNEWVDEGEFPPSLGSFATIPKAKQGLLLIAPGTNTLMRFTWTSHLAIVFQLAVFVMPSFLFTG